MAAVVMDGPDIPVADRQHRVNGEGTKDPAL